MFWENHFIPATISESSISEPLQQFIAFSIQLGGMAVTISYLNTEAEYNASKLLLKNIVDQIINQNTEYKSNKIWISEIKNDIKKGRTKVENTIPSRIRDIMSKRQIRANSILQQPSCSNLLNIILIYEFMI